MGLLSRLFGKKKKDENEIIMQEDMTEIFVEEADIKINSEEAIISAPAEEAKPEQMAKPKVQKKTATAKKAKMPEAEKKNTTTASNTKNLKESEAEEKAAEAPKPTKSGRFEIKKAKDGRYVFNLYASNHVIVATSQVYSSSSSAINGINSIIANAERAGIEDQTLKKYEILPYPKWEIYEDKGGQYRFRLSAPNGSCIVHSQGYTSKANCKNGIESIIKFASGAEIDKAYLKSK